MNRLSVTICLLLFAASPSTELQAAGADVASIKNLVDRPHVRWLTVYHLDAPEAGNVASFVANSLGRRTGIYKPRRTGTLLRIDLREYRWDAKAWDALAVGDVYFQFPYAIASEADHDYVAKYNLYKQTGTQYPIMRLDYFVAKATLEPHYSAFLQLPPNLKELQDAFFVSQKAVEVLGHAQGGSVLQSIVALHNRQLERWPSYSGAWWISRDAKTSSGKQNVLEPANIFTIEHDAGEFIWSLPNGLQSYYLANADGKQQVEVPPDIAIDSRTSLQDKRVRNAMSCITCHATGINSFENVIARIIPKGATVGAYDKEVALRIEEYHRSPLAEKITEDCERFAKAVYACNELTPEANALAYETIVKQYLEGRVDLLVATKDLGCSEQHLKSIANAVQSGTLNAILVGESVSRDAWESIYSKVAKYKEVVK